MASNLETLKAYLAVADAVAILETDEFLAAPSSF